MAEIAPFKGIRYDESVVGDLTKVVSPPYDIISPEDRVYYHDLHPANFVRLILGEEFEADSERDNRFLRARRYLDQWLVEGTLKQDPEPAIYVYEQRFERDGARATIRGFTCAVRVHDYADRVILPHEDTLAKPKSQLIQLMREAKANLDSIYGLYADENCVLNEALDTSALRPDAEAFDKNSVRHRLWVVCDPEKVAAVVDFLRDKPIAIADGHHRYETALNYRNEMRQRTGSEDAPSEFTLMTLVNVYQEDMTIYPTHRVVGGLSEDVMNQLDRRVGELFDVRQARRDDLQEAMRASGAIGMHRKDSNETLKLKNGAGDLLKGSEASRNLELNILHALILDHCLGIDEDKLRNQTHIIYTRDPNEAMGLVDSGQRQIAFLLNHIDVKSVLDVASAGERMPQKATYFYPKLISGLVLRKMD